MVSRFFLLCATYIVLMPATPAAADEDEASIEGQLIYGIAEVGDNAAGDLTDVVDYLGFGVRATYARSNWYAYELSVSYANLARSAYFSDETSELFRRMAWLRFDAGISARFDWARIPWRWTPIVNVAFGTQLRLAGQGHQRSIDQPGSTSTIGGDLGVEFVGTLGLGLDYRPRNQWIFGVLATAQSAVTAQPRFAAAGVTLYIARYFYWFP